MAFQPGKRGSTHQSRGTASRGPAFATRRSEPVEVDWEELRQIQGKVTAIETQAKDPDRRSLYVDGRFVLGLHGEILYMAALRVGDQIEGQRLVELLQRELEKRCWDDALRFLARAPHARREVERKLARRWPEELITRVIARLERGGWLDDGAFARVYMEAHPGYGPRRLLGDLVRKGVDRELAERVLAELTAVATERRAAFNPQEEQSLGRPAVGDPETVRILALKKLTSVAGLDRVAAERRLGGFLLRRGFGMEEVRGVLRELLDGFPPPAPRPRKGWGRAAKGQDAPEED
ncbi:MAG TPA: regulatory protein RecX [Symbiobacteriaceae bacterium]|nr:regulatory protein RecX [Symbiobacteriaceae bacterium]